MSKIIKESSPWGEITNYYYEYLDVISQRDTLRAEVERLKAELERVYKKLAANHVLEVEAENTRWREIASFAAEAIRYDLNGKVGDGTLKFTKLLEVLALYDAEVLKK